MTTHKPHAPDAPDAPESDAAAHAPRVPERPTIEALPASRMTLEDATRKVAALLKLAERSGSPEEAATAAAKASSIMATYQIEREVALADPNAREAADEEVANFDDPALAIPMGDRGKPSERIAWWKFNLANTVARAHGCSVYAHDDLGQWETGHDPKYSWRGRFTGKRQVICFVGRPSDVATSRYLLAFLIDQCNTQCDACGRGMGRTWRNNFRLGFARKMGERLYAERERLYEEMRAQASASPNPDRALVRVENAIARVQARRDEAQKWANDHLSLTNASPGQISYDDEARSAGKDAAEKVVIRGARGSLGSGGAR